LDNLHFNCNKSNKPIEYWLNKFRDTWEDFTPIFHWSEGGANGKIRSHLDYFSHIPQFIVDNPDVIWEAEVKKKDIAIKKVLDLAGN